MQAACQNRARPTLPCTSGAAMKTCMPHLVHMACGPRCLMASCRRRELQLVRRTQGFAWGHSAIATTEWTGVPLRGRQAGSSIHPFQVQSGGISQSEVAHMPQMHQQEALQRHT